MKHTSTPQFVPLWLFFSSTAAFVEIPLFSQLELLYPGYPAHGGTVPSTQLWQQIFGSNNKEHRQHNTAALRLSWTLNRYGGRHNIGQYPIHLPNLGLVSSQGVDGHQYIYNNTAFGPWLALKYGNPAVLPLSHAPKHNRHHIHHFLQGKKGIVRVVSYHRDHPGGHIGLWKCDHWIQSKDFTKEHSLLAVEIWETPDSVCQHQRRSPPPKMVAANTNDGTLLHQQAIRSTVQHRPIHRKKLWKN